VLAPKVMYWALRNWLLNFATRWGLQVELVDMTDPAAVQAAIRPGHTRLVWVETPANPLWTVTDIAATAAIAHAAGARLAVDSTVATPLLTQPLALGADLVMHAATKYLNGHSDVVAGVLVTRVQDEAWTRIRQVRSQVGGTLGSFEAFLLTRGMRTLALRVRQACASAQRIAEHFEHHRHVAAVLYPGLPAFAGHEVARRQMRGYGGVMAVQVRGGSREAERVMKRLRLFAQAVSLGGVESLAVHAASMWAGSLDDDALRAAGIAPNLIRLSIGLEHTDDLIADLRSALGAG
jgi:cystathionine gamma-synthase